MYDPGIHDAVGETALRVFDTSRDAVMIRCDQGIVRYANPAASRCYGMPLQDMVGESIFKLFPTEFPALHQSIADHLKSADTWEGSLLRRSPGGENAVFDLLCMTGPELIPKRPLTIEVARETAISPVDDLPLRLVDFHHRSMVQAMAVSFWTIDFGQTMAAVRDLEIDDVDELERRFHADPVLIRELIGTLRILDVNDYSLQLFGAETKEQLIAHAPALWMESQFPVFFGGILAALREQPSYRTEARLIACDGSGVDVLFTTSHTQDIWGYPTNIIGLVDITDRNNAQAALTQLQSDFAHASRVSLLGEMTASIAHEVNQPLAAISANASAGLRLLKRETPDLEDVIGALEDMVRDARRAADIIDRIRAMSTKKPATQELIGVDGLVSEVALLVAHEFLNSEARLESLIPSQSVVLGDRVQLQQVILNLVINALQAMKDTDASERVVLIRSAKTSIDGVGNALIQVVDRGAGIDAGDPDKPFQPFYTTKGAGMGMGLAICRSIVETHGGKIWAERNALVGSTFSVLLPLVDGIAK